MNLYNGSTGARHYIPEAAEPSRQPSPLPPPGGVTEEVRREQHEPPRRPSRGPGAGKPPGPLHDLMGGLGGILSRLDPGRLETEDLLVLAILWLLYRESGDKELLIALGAYLFL